MGKEITGGLALRIAAQKMKVGSVRVKCLLLYYATLADKDGQFYRSYLDIYLDTGITERTVRSINRSLTRCEVLTQTEPEFGSGDATNYQLHIDAMHKNVEAFKADRDKRAAAQRSKHTERMRAWREKKKKELSQVTATGSDV